MTNQQNLDQQLDAYTERAARKHPGKRSAAELIAYSAAAGGLAFAGGDAIGAVVHNTSSLSTSASSTNSAFNWDIDGNGGTFRFQLYGYSGTGNNWVIASSNNYDNAVGSSANSLASALSPGFVVGPTLATGVFADYMDLMASSTSGSFISNTGYLGLRFPGQTGTVGTQYGWAKVHVETFGGGDQGVRLSIFEWAFDNCGDPIAVGATSGGQDCSASSVPAPATPLLALLGLGAMGMQTYRRRRDAGLKRLADERAAA